MEEERGVGSGLWVPSSSLRDTAVGPEPLLAKWHIGPSPTVARDQRSQTDSKEMVDAGVGPENVGPPPAPMRNACVGPSSPGVGDRDTQTRIKGGSIAPPQRGRRELAQL